MTDPTDLIEDLHRIGHEDGAYIEVIAAADMLDALRSQLTAANRRADKADAAGYARGLRDAANVCVDTDFNDSDEVRVWAYIKHRILALIPAKPTLDELHDVERAKLLKQIGKPAETCVTQTAGNVILGEAKP